MSARPTLAEVRADVGRWARERQFEWAERAAIVAEGCGCDQEESEIRAFEMLTRRQLVLRFTSA